MNALLKDMSDNEQHGVLFSLALSSASIGDDARYRPLVERLKSDREFEASFREFLLGSNLVMLDSSLDHGVALAQGDGAISVFCANRTEFTDGRVNGRSQLRLKFVRHAAAIAVCAAAFPKGAEVGDRGLVSFTVDDVIELMRRAASEAKIPEENEDEDKHMPEADEIIASVIQHMPSDEQRENAVRTLRANVVKTIETFERFGYLIARPKSSDGVVDYIPAWRLTRLVQHHANRTLVARLREAA